MVLQQEAALPVWGWAEPGEKVTVAFNGKQAAATAGADGKWRAALPACAAGTPPGTLVVTGKNTLVINDVLAGDVWLCSGQSNMEFGLDRGHAAEASDNQIRLFMWRINSPSARGITSPPPGRFARRRLSQALPQSVIFSPRISSPPSTGR